MRVIKILNQSNVICIAPFGSECFTDVSQMTDESIIRQKKCRPQKQQKKDKNTKNSLTPAHARKEK